MSKLQHYGVRGLLLQLLHSYLHNRSQKVLSNERISKFLRPNCGVPQDSIMGSLLF